MNTYGTPAKSGRSVFCGAGARGVAEGQLLGGAAFVWWNPRCPVRMRVAGAEFLGENTVPGAGMRGGARQGLPGACDLGVVSGGKAVGRGGGKPYPGRVFGKMRGGVRNF